MYIPVLSELTSGNDYDISSFTYQFVRLLLHLHPNHPVSLNSTDLLELY